MYTRKVKKLFQTIDLSGDGTINLEEFAKLVQSPKLKFLGIGTGENFPCSRMNTRTLCMLHVRIELRTSFLFSQSFPLFHPSNTQVLDEPARVPRSELSSNYTSQEPHLLGFRVPHPCCVLYVPLPTVAHGTFHRLGVHSLKVLVTKAMLY